MVLTLAEFRNAHRGAAIVVCGCGESLNLLERPERFVTIGVNDVGRRFTPDYLVVVNRRSQFSADRFRFIERSRAQALFTHVPDLGVDHPNVVRFRLGQYGGTEDTDPDALHYTRNSPYVAVCLAMHMGARRIGVIGVDFTDDHFFAPTGPHALTAHLPEIQREYGRLAAACRERGIDLVNLSPTSRLTALVHEPLARFVEAAAALAPAPVSRRVFFVNYHFLSCGDVFATGLAHAAAALRIEHRAAWWDDPELPAKVKAFAPDLVFVVHGRRFVQRWGDALRGFRRSVWLLDEPYEVDDTARWSSAFDIVFVNDPVTLVRHRNAYPLPTCFDPVLHHDPEMPRDYDVGFIGGYNPVRERSLARLADEGLLSYVVGGPWQARVLHALHRAASSAPAETARLYQRTRIVVNVFRSVHHFNRRGMAATALNPRVFEALACGALVVSEPRPALATTFPELPTFTTDDELVSTIRKLLGDPAAAGALTAASRGRLASQDYAHRLATALEVALGEPPRLRLYEVQAPMQIHTREVEAVLPDGWVAVGRRPPASHEGALVLGADAGLATRASFGALRLSFEVRLDTTCRFIARLHQATPADSGADSYHLLATPTEAYAGRQGAVFARVAMKRGAWQKVEMTCRNGGLTLAIDGREVCRCADTALDAGHGFIGVTGGSAALRAVRVEPLDGQEALLIAPGWTVRGAGTVTSTREGLSLSADRDGGVGLVSETALNDVELRFWVRLDAAAHFVAKIHHQPADDPNANSYHLVSAPTRHYLARHDHIFAPLALTPGRWHRVQLSWIDQHLELILDGRRVIRVADHLLPSGYAAVWLARGRVEIRALSLREVVGVATGAAPALVPRRVAGDAIPFTGTPRRNLLYHVWPVRGATWRWNVEQLRTRLDLFNGRRVIAIAHDPRSEDPDEVRKLLDGDGCEFIVAPNAPEGEGVTFLSLLARVRSVDPNEVTFYGHAKGVRFEPSVPHTVRRWTDVMYRAALDHWPAVRAQLERFAMTGSLKMLGRVRAHRFLGDWHYSGTFFWLRHSRVFVRDVETLEPFYGCVEAWPGVHFAHDETGCLFMDGLRQLPYHQAFWTTTGDDAFARWEARQPSLPPPADLATPSPFEGHVVPRLEERPDEFGWFLGELVATAPRRILVIGSMHGGIEWHIARRFRAIGRDVRITAVGLRSSEELDVTIAAARREFNQDVELVIGDSTAAETRARLAPQYDAVFIDGNHTYRAVHADVAFALTRSPRLVALHDIVDSDWHAQARCCVSRAWAELRKRHNSDERGTADWAGVGLLRC